MERDTPFETPWASNHLPNPRICPPWWLGRHTTKSPRHSARYSPDARYGEKRGPRIDRHPMGLCRCFLSQIVGGHTDDDIRHCGGPIGSKRRQKRLSSVIFHGFGPFSRRDGQRLLPRLLHSVVRLLWPFFVSEFVARGCPCAEYEAAFLAILARTCNPSSA